MQYRGLGVFIISITLFSTFALGTSTFSQTQAVKEILISDYKFKFHGTGYETSAHGILHDKMGKPLLTLNNLLLNISYRDVVIGDELFWISGPEGPDFMDKRKVELCVTNLITKETKTIFSDQRIDFKVNHRTNIMAISHDSYDSKAHTGHSTVTLVDRGHKRKTEIVNKAEKYTTGLYYLLGWSTDDSMLWIGSGDLDSWSQLILYRNGKIEKFNDIHGGEDFIIDCDRGWVTFSDYPDIHTSDEGDDFRKSRVITTLWLYDAINHRRAKVASGRANLFSPEWDRTLPNNPKLIYFVGEKKYIVDPARLLMSKRSVSTTQE